MKVNRKKICIVTTVSLTVKSFFLEQIEFLSSNGYEITIICNGDKKLRKILPKNTKFVEIPMRRGIDPIGSIKAIKSMRRLFKINKFDIVQYSTPNASLYASIASKLAGIDIRLYHNMGFRYSSSKGIKRIILKEIEKITCLLSTEVQTVSFSNLEFGLKEKLFNKRESRVIWNGSTGGVNLDKFNINKKEKWQDEIYSKLGINRDTFIFGFIGRITRDKGINELLESYKCLTSIKNTNSCLVLVGEEENTYSLDDSLYSWAKNRSDILFIGKTDEVYKYLSTFDVLVLPSYREGFGNVVIEAQAMGVPVIVTDIPGPIDAMKKDETGIVVEKMNIHSLLDSMKFMLNNPCMCRKMGEKAYYYVLENFDSKKLLKYILEDKDRLISKSS